jgi:UDP-2,3-diacylglucosamine pyrophosphatase LpxH
MADATSFIFVSDFHLGVGKYASTGKIDQREEFFSDAVFEHFLENLYQRARQENLRWRLVLLGDIFDFLRVNLTGDAESSHIDTSLDAARLKLQAMAAGHPVFFQALRLFLERGFGIDILPGNHDIELVRPETQAVMKDLLAGSGSPLREQIAFHPWIYYVPGLFYAEHGQQYHAINASATPLAPYPTRSSANRLLVPFGSYLENYLFDLSQSVFPQQNLPPGMRVLIKGIKEKPAAMISNIPLHARFAGQALRSWLAGIKLPGRSADYEQQFLPEYAAKIGLPVETLRAIHGLSSANPLGVIPRLLRRSGVHYLYQACLNIHRLLEGQGKQVPFYVFGHSHAPVKQQLSPTASAAYYLNCGSWAGPPSNLAGFPFVEIHHQNGRSSQAASLLSWDEQSGSSAPYPSSLG